MDKPNILLITTDQQRFDTICALGNSKIYTPHLNWLVDEGITYSNCYSDCPVCMPARATIMVGKAGYDTGLVSNNNNKIPMKNNPTLPSLLTKAGYQTRAQGKMHFHPMRANYGFEHMELPMDYYRDRCKNQKEGLPKQHGVGENEVEPVISTVDETDSLTYWTVERSIDFLETRDESRPFFMWTSFTKPHPPFDPCRNYWELYANKDMPKPVYGDWSENIDDVPQGLLSSTYCLNSMYRFSEEQINDVRKAYYACITQIDYSLGLLFARMREMDLLENTWIIFTTDHGEMLGDHHMGAKSVFLEGSAHIPFIVRPPAKSWAPKPLGGIVCDDPISLVDVLPSILNMAGVEIPEGLDGTDIVKLVDLPQNRTFFGNHSDDFFMIKKNSIKYHLTSYDGAELLFDLSTDPYEQKNLIGNSEYKDIHLELKAELLEQIKYTRPDMIKDGELVTKPSKSCKEVNKWPGFHSIVVPTDVLHQDN